MSSLTQLIVHTTGAELIYIPLYSPDMNPIEQSFSAIKAGLRRHEDEAIRPEVRPWLIHRAIFSVTEYDAVGWIANCGYSWLRVEGLAAYPQNLDYITFFYYAKHG